MNQEIKQLLKDANLTEDDSLTMQFFVSAVEDGLTDFHEKTFLFKGDPGIGKTYFVEHLLKSLDMPIFFLGPFKFEHKNCTQFDNFKKLYEELLKTDRCIAFIDDLQNSFEFERDGMGEWLTDSERKTFLNMLEHIKRSKQKKFLFITLNDDASFEESWLDRLEMHVELEEPKEKSKKAFLLNKYKKYLSNSMINELAEKSMGYNFRNLDELIKIAFRKGSGRITKNSIKQALSSYVPTSMAHYDIVHKTGIRFEDIIGQENLKRDLNYLKTYIKNPRFFTKNGIERSNMLIFSGPPGAGKTFMAKAIAGELDIPLVNLSAIDLHRGGPIMGVRQIARTARRFRNCVVFIDEVDKLIGSQMMSEEDAVIGSLEAELDGIRDKTKAIIIMTMNNKSRFGSAFHDRIPSYDFNLPSKKERKDFLEKKINKSRLPVNENNISSIINETENKSFRQVDKIWNNILFKIMDNPDVKIKNNILLANEEQINNAINEIMGFVERANSSSMFG